MSRTTEAVESSVSTNEPPGLWIELESIAESISEKSNHDTVSIYSSSGDEKQDHNISHEESAKSSKKDASVASTIESDIVYPSTLRVSLVTVSLAIAIFLVGLDRTIVATATPRITNDFHSLSDASWYTSAYLLTTTTLQPTWGKVYQSFPLKGVFMLVMSFVMIGSLICATAENTTIFIIGRAISGIGAGGVLSGSLTITAYTVPLCRRPRFTGGLTSLFGIANFVGPVLGGVFTDKVTWRWCFYINLPLGAITIAGIIIILQNPRHLATNKTIKQRLRELDYIGPAFFIPANVCILLALQWAGSLYSWNSPIILGLFSGFGGFMTLWIYSQYRLGDKATIPLRILNQRTVLFSSLYGFFATSAFMIPIFYIPLYFQAIKNTSATTSAIDTLPFIVGVTATSIGAGFLVAKVGYFTPFMIVGAAVLAIGTGLLSTLRVNTRVVQWLWYQVITGIGAGLSLQMSTIAAQAVVCLRDIPIATSTSVLFQQLGPVLFIAVSQSAILNQLLPQVQAINPHLTAIDIIRAGVTGLETLVSETQLPKVLVSYANSLDLVFKLTAGLSIIAFILAFGVEWKNIKIAKKIKDVEERK